MDDLIEKIMTTRWTGGMIFVLYLVFSLRISTLYFVA